MSTLANYNNIWLSPPPPPPSITPQGNFIIVQQNLVEYAAQGVTFYVTNLSSTSNDAQLVPHYTSRGISRIYDFVNNGNGTGSFKVDFLENYLVYTMILYTLDSFGIPYNSGYAVSYALTDANVGDTFILYPKIYPKSYLFYSMMNNIPNTRFLNINQPFTVPYSSHKTTFNFEVKETGIPVTIDIKSLSDKTRKRSRTIIPTTTKFSEDIQLSKDTNIITISTANDSYTIFVACTTFAVWLDAYAEEIYNYVVFFLENQYSSILNNFSSVLAMPVLKEEFQDIFPNSSVYSAVALRMYAKSLLNNASKQKGFTDLFKGFFQSNPVIVKNETAFDNFDMVENPIYNDGELFSGNDIHLWSDNYCIATWHLFKKYLLNTRQTLLDATPNRAVFYDNNDELQYSLFSLLDSNCSVFDEFLSEELCYDGLDVEVAGELFFNIQFCINYPMDSFLQNVDQPDYADKDIEQTIGTLLAPNSEPYLNLTGNNLSFFITPQTNYEQHFGTTICYSENKEPYLTLAGKNLYLSVKDYTGTVISNFTVNFTTETSALAVTSKINSVVDSNIMAYAVSSGVALKATLYNLYISMEGIAGVVPSYNALSTLGNFYKAESFTLPDVSTSSGVVSAVNSLATDIRSFKEPVYSYTCVNVGPYPTLPLTASGNNVLRMEGLREDGTVLDTTIYFVTAATMSATVFKINTDCPYTDLLATSGSGGEVKLYTTGNTIFTNITGTALSVLGDFDSSVESYKVRFETKDFSTESNLKLDFSGTTPAVSTSFGFTGFALGKTQTKRNYTMMLKDKAHLISQNQLPFSLSGIMSIFSIPKTINTAEYGPSAVCYSGFVEPFAFNGNNVPSELTIGILKDSGYKKYYTIYLTIETSCTQIVSSVNAAITGSEFYAASVGGRVSFQPTDQKDRILVKTNTFGFVELGNIVLIDKIKFTGNNAADSIRNQIESDTNYNFTAYPYYEDISRYLVINATDRFYDTEFYFPVLEEDNQILLSAMGYSYVAPTPLDRLYSEINSERGFEYLEYISRWDSGYSLDSFIPRQVTYGLIYTILPEPYYNLNSKYFSIQYLSSDNVSFATENIKFSGTTFSSTNINTAQEVADYINDNSHYVYAFPKDTGHIAFQSMSNEDNSQVRFIENATACSFYAFGWNDYYSTNKGDFTIAVSTGVGFDFVSADGTVTSKEFTLSATTYTAESLAESITDYFTVSGASMAQAIAVGDSLIVRCLKTDYIMLFDVSSGGYVALGGFTKGEVSQTDVLLPCALTEGHAVALGILVDRTLMLTDLVSCSGILIDP